MSDLVFTPAYQLAQMIRDRQVSAVEVLNAYLAQIAKHNPQLNAICTGCKLLGSVGETWSYWRSLKNLTKWLVTFSLLGKSSEFIPFQGLID